MTGESADVLPVTSPSVSSDMNVTAIASPNGPTSMIQPPNDPEAEMIPTTGDTGDTGGGTVSPESDTPPVRNVPTARPAISPVWTLEDVASHYKTSTRTIRRWIKDPAKAPVRLHALLGDDGAEAVPLQVTGNLPPVRKSWEGEPEDTGDPDTTAVVHTPREADLTEIFEGLSRELHQQFRDEISRLVSERDAEREARLKAEIRAALAEDRAVRVQNALDDATTAGPPLLAPPSEEPRIGRWAHFLASIRIG